MTDPEPQQDNSTPNPAVEGIQGEIAKIWPGMADKFNDDPNKQAEAYNQLEPALTKAHQENASLKQEIESLKSPQTPEDAPQAPAEESGPQGSAFDLTEPQKPSVGRAEEVSELLKQAEAEFAETNTINPELRAKLSEATALGSESVDAVVAANQIIRQQIETEAAEALGGVESLTAVMNHIKSTKHGQERVDLQKILSEGSADMIQVMLKGIQSQMPQTQKQITGVSSSSGGKPRPLDPGNPNDLVSALEQLGNGDYHNPQVLEFFADLQKNQRTDRIR